jgi:hypothetical protein
MSAPIARIRQKISFGLALSSFKYAVIWHIEKIITSLLSFYIKVIVDDRLGISSPRLCASIINNRSRLVVRNISGARDTVLAIVSGHTINDLVHRHI